MMYVSTKPSPTKKETTDEVEMFPSKPFKKKQKTKEKRSDRRVHILVMVTLILPHITF